MCRSHVKQTMQARIVSLLQGGCCCALWQVQHWMQKQSPHLMLLSGCSLHVRCWHGFLCCQGMAEFSPH
jgi:hypothetical protein